MTPQVLLHQRLAVDDYSFALSTLDLGYPKFLLKQGVNTGLDKSGASSALVTSGSARGHGYSSSCTCPSELSAIRWH